MHDEQVTLPFILSLGLGFVETQGLATASPAGLCLEIAVKDPLIGQITIANREITLSYDLIKTVHLSKRWFTTSVELETISARALRNVPGGRQGRMSLLIASQEKHLVDPFMLALRSFYSEHQLRQLEA